MRRFFKPVEKEGSAKKPSLSPSKPGGENGGPQQQEDIKREPLKFVTWNANSLLLRVKNNWAQFSNFISNLDPDIVALQEVRMPAAGSKGAAKNPGELKDDTSSSREEKQSIELSIATISSARRTVSVTLSALFQCILLVCFCHNKTSGIDHCPVSLHLSEECKEAHCHGDDVMILTIDCIYK